VEVVLKEALQQVVLEQGDIDHHLIVKLLAVEVLLKLLLILKVGKVMILPLEGVELFQEVMELVVLVPLL
tara:strand:+ start:365 stop:574 length:210 start_codon:yes stop_codon:yes gene_type:complete